MILISKARAILIEIALAFVFFYAYFVPKILSPASPRPGTI